MLFFVAMRSFNFLLLALIGVLPTCGQTANPAAPGLPTDPRQILAAAAPHYDFAAADLKPWHLKATYQLYDAQGNPTLRGTYEYWWASPEVHHSSWSRPGMTRDDWHTADGKHPRAESGERPQFFETRLESALLSPMPRADDIAPEKVRLDRQTMPDGNAKLSCVMAVPNMPALARSQVLQLGLFPTFCFDPKLPALRLSWSAKALAIEYNKIVTMKDHYLAREITMFEGKRKLLSAEVDSITGLELADANLLPPASPVEVKEFWRVELDPSVSVGNLIQKTSPIYPRDAENARISGRVILHGLIGIDGAVHELKVVSAPWPSLAASALECVSNWEYRPYLLLDKPVDVETTFNVIYQLKQ